MHRPAAYPGLPLLLALVACGGDGVATTRATAVDLYGYWLDDALDEGRRSVTWFSPGDPYYVELLGASDVFLTYRTEDASEPAGAPWMAGTYRVEEGRLYRDLAYHSNPAIELPATLEDELLEVVPGEALVLGPGEDADWPTPERPLSWYERCPFELEPDGWTPGRAPLAAELGHGPARVAVDEAGDPWVMRTSTSSVDPGTHLSTLGGTCEWRHRLVGEPSAWVDVAQARTTV